MAKAANSASKALRSSELKARRIGGVEINPAKPAAKVPAETAARIRDAVRSVYGEKKKA